MSYYNKSFEVIAPSLDNLQRRALPVSNVGFVTPGTASPNHPLIAGEFVADVAGGKYARATDATKLFYPVIEDYGDFGVQASKKISAIRFGSFEADTTVFDPAVVTLGAALTIGTVSIGGVNRAALVAYPGSPAGELVAGYVTKIAADNGGRLRFIRIG